MISIELNLIKIQCIVILLKDHLINGKVHRISWDVPVNDYISCDTNSLLV